MESARFQKQLESLYENPFDDGKFKIMDDDLFEDEVNNLIEWCEDLDYDKYCESWHTMATSAKPQVTSDDNNVQVLSAGLGDLTIGLNSPPMAISQQIPGIPNLMEAQGTTDSKMMSGMSTKVENAAKMGLDPIAGGYSSQQAS